MDDELNKIYLGDFYHSELLAVGPPNANTSFTNETQEGYWRSNNDYDIFKEDNFVGLICFSWLLPGGSIGKHRDSLVSNLHGASVAITNPKGCHFHNERAGIIDFDTNPAHMMDYSAKHWVVNNSLEPRLHMIYSGKVPGNVIERSYKKHEIQNR